MLNKKVYHGTDKELSVLKPIGVNMGHRWAKPQWSIFFWGDYTKAYKWAVYQVCRRSTKIDLMYHLPTGGFAITETNFKLLVKQIQGKKGYVYHATIPRLQLGYGSSPDIEEYTYNKNVVPEDTTVINIDTKILSTVAVILSENTYAAYRSDVISGKYSGKRGFLYSLLMDSERDQLRHDYHKKIRQGILSPGDDLSKISLEQRPSWFDW